jgi:hypothetical protein
MAADETKPKTTEPRSPRAPSKSATTQNDDITLSSFVNRYTIVAVGAIIFFADLFIVGNYHIATSLSILRYSGILPTLEGSLFNVGSIAAPLAVIVFLVLAIVCWSSDQLLGIQCGGAALFFALVTLTLTPRNQFKALASPNLVGDSTARVPCNRLDLPQVKAARATTGRSRVKNKASLVVLHRNVEGTWDFDRDAIRGFIRHWCSDSGARCFPLLH